MAHWQNLWSFAGDSDRADVNQMLIQYFINYNLPHGWYLISAPIITANWEADSDDRWTMRCQIQTLLPKSLFK